MNRKRSHWLAIGLLLATGAAGVVLSLYALSGFGNSGSRDTLFSPNSTSFAGLTIVLLALMTRIALELMDAAGRRPSRRGQSPDSESHRV